MKKVLSIVLSLIMVVSMSSMAFAEPYSDLETATYSVATVENSVLTSSGQKNSNKNMKLSQMTLQDIQKYDLIVLDENSLSNLERDAAIAFLQAGGVLSVDTSNANQALSDIYKLLGEEEPIDIDTVGTEQVGAYLSMRNGRYVPGVISLGVLSSENDADISLDSVTHIDETPCSLSEKIDTNNFLKQIDAQRYAVQPQLSLNNSDVAPMSAPSNFNYVFDNYTSFKSDRIGNQVMGSVLITQYVYKICTYRSGSKTTVISDVVSHISVDAGKLSYVKTYNTRMGVSGSTMSIIDQTYLKSDSSSSVSLSGGFSANSSSVVTGSVNASTSYSYSTNNQTITNDFASNKYNNWNSSPTKKWMDSSWVLNPGIRMKNTDSSVKNSAYTTVEKIAFKWHYMGAQGGTEVYTKPLTVTGRW